MRTGTLALAVSAHAVRVAGLRRNGGALAQYEQHAIGRTGLLGAAGGVIHRFACALHRGARDEQQAARSLLCKVQARNRREYRSASEAVTRARLVVAGMALLVSAQSAMAGALAEWNEHAFRAAYSTRMTSFPELAGLVATLDVAMFEASNAIERRYVPHLFAESAPIGASSSAAAHSAAYSVLAQRFPGYTAILSNAYRQALAGIPDGVRKEDGIKLGQKVAAAILKSRQAEPLVQGDSWVPQVTLGSYVPTTEVVAPLLGSSTPWLLRSASQFRPTPPLAIESTEFQKDLREVADLGEMNSRTRTKNQTEAARFWALSGVHAWNRMLVQLLDEVAANEVDQLRAGALLNMALADSYIAAWDAKYTYAFWRPVTAVRRLEKGLSTQNGATGWRPLLETPLHPEYPSGHSTNAGVGLGIISALFPERKWSGSYRIQSEDPHGPARTFKSPTDMASEISDARVWAGIHFRFSCNAGVVLGRRIAEHAIETTLKPAQSRSQ